MSGARLRRGLYAISQEQDDTAALLDWAAAVIAGGAACIQYRDKSENPARRRRQAGALAALCTASAVPFIVNDDVDLAADCGADGVHLGEHDGDPRRARARLGGTALIGVSCYNDLARARQLAGAGADYLAFGAFFDSRSKPAARRASPAILASARALGLPLVAIGGITPDNGGDLVRAGADLLAVIGGLSGAPEQAADTARRYAALFAAHPLPSSTDRSS